MDFTRAAMLINEGQSVQRRRRPGGRLIVKSRADAYAKMGVEDWMAEDWEVYRGKAEPIGPNWLP